MVVFILSCGILACFLKNEGSKTHLFAIKMLKIEFFKILGHTKTYFDSISSIKAFAEEKEGGGGDKCPPVVVPKITIFHHFPVEISRVERWNAGKLLLFIIVPDPFCLLSGKVTLGGREGAAAAAACCCL
jgi:hypothetical protein